ncbi:hypothetical protein Taro_050933 [Colocasia esculenta]|uniref:AP2/ERF domain-containing protein n=1 Tax=Colocasia esculenta TaxID=4460 RepID=A0A843XFD3_COLES|nr:hypothetical protein [Colocasia esculenta]
MENFNSHPDSLFFDGAGFDFPAMMTLPSGSAASDEETYMTVSSAPPKRRAGRTKFRETRHPVFKGVRRRSAGKWVCEVREPNKKSRIWLGTFPTAEMAARAHDVAAMALRGRSACLNFADSAWLLPVLPPTATAREIQQAAAQAVERFRPPESEAAQLEDADGQVDMVETPPPTATAEAAAAGVGDGYYVDGDLSYVEMLGNMGMMSPQHAQMQQWPGQCGGYWDDMETEHDMSLWSYTI